MKICSVLWTAQPPGGTIRSIQPIIKEGPHESEQSMSPLGRPDPVPSVVLRPDRVRRRQRSGPRHFEPVRIGLSAVGPSTRCWTVWIQTPPSSTVPAPAWWVAWRAWTARKPWTLSPSPLRRKTTPSSEVLTSLKLKVDDIAVSGSNATALCTLSYTASNGEPTQRELTVTLIQAEVDGARNWYTLDIR